MAAWSALNGGAADGGITVLKGEKDGRLKGKSSVYRLAWDGGRRSMIAKAASTRPGSWGEGIGTEVRLYRTVLPALDIRLPGFVGSVDDPRTGRTWIFIGDAGDVVFDAEVEEHRNLAARYMAELHVRASAIDGLDELPDRSTGYYRERLRDGLDRIGRNLDRARSADERRLLLDVADLLDVLEGDWNGLVAARAATLPPTLVHGDAKGKNLRVVQHAGRSRLVAFDWELAGLGCVGPDLAHVDLETYHRCVLTRWPQIGMRDLVEAKSAGALLRFVAAIADEALSLDYDWPERTMWRFRYYRDHLADLLDGVAPR